MLSATLVEHFHAFTTEVLRIGTDGKEFLDCLRNVQLPRNESTPVHTIQDRTANLIRPHSLARFIIATSKNSVIATLRDFCLCIRDIAWHAD